MIWDTRFNASSVTTKLHSPSHVFSLNTESFLTKLQLRFAILRMGLSSTVVAAILFHTLFPSTKTFDRVLHESTTFYDIKPETAVRLHKSLGYRSLRLSRFHQTQPCRCTSECSVHVCHLIPKHKTSVQSTLVRDQERQHNQHSCITLFTFSTENL